MVITVAICGVLTLCSVGWGGHVNDPTPTPTPTAPQAGLLEAAIILFILFPSSELLSPLFTN